MSALRISVVIPHFNDAVLLRAAVASVQESEPVEVLVVDDASTAPDVEPALERLAAEGVRVVRQLRNAGPAAAVNRGASEAGGVYVFRLDSDDLLMPGALKPLADVLDARPEIDFAYGDYEFVGARTGLMRSYEWEPWRAVYANCWPAAFMIRRDALLDVGGVPSGTPFEDWDLYMTLAEQGRAGVRVPGVTYRYRIGTGDRRSQTNRANLREETRRLRRRHPALWASRNSMQREAGVPAWIRWSYPVVYDLRTRLPERGADLLFDTLAAVRRGYHRLAG